MKQLNWNVSSIETLLEQQSVRKWFDDYHRYWKDETDRAFKLQVLASFCAFVGKPPDEIIADCFRDTGDGYKKIRGKRRKFYIAKIKEFESSLTDVNPRAWGNVVRSFFIHNGIAMSADPLR